MTREQAEAAIGTARGRLGDVTKDNRPMVAKWMTALGFRAAFVGGLSNRELMLAYNDVDAAMPFLTKLKAKQDAALELERDVGDAPFMGSGNGAAPPAAPQSPLPPQAVGSVEQAITALIAASQAQSAAQLDEAKVKDIAADIAFNVVTTALRDYTPSNQTTVVQHNVEVKLPDGATALIEQAHPNMAKLVRAALAKEPSGYTPGIFLAGEASSGKTTGCKQLAKALNLPWHFNGAISMPHEMLGFIDAAGHYHRTPFREAYEHGGVYTFDEVDRSDPVALLAVNPHLANGVATFPDGQITRHPDCIIICTANTWGHGADAQYVGATKLDAAFLSRFPVRIQWDINEDLETKICNNKHWAQHVQKIRKICRDRGLKVMVDVRCSIAGASLLAAGFPFDEVCELTYLANLTKGQKQQLNDAIAQANNQPAE